MHSKEPILLVGTGKMALEYAKVLKFLKKSCIAVGLDEKKAALFAQATGFTALGGGLKSWIEKKNQSIPSTAIVAVDIEQLGPVARQLLVYGTKSILLEKPGGIDLADLKKTEKLTVKNKAGVFIAYNRRFYSSTQKAKDLIKKNGGVTSFSFDFTEWSSRIKKSVISAAVKKEWLLANSSHVLDLAFFLGGAPEKIKTYARGGLDWHPRASIYAGAGISQKGALFSYHANWESAGRWGLEIMTPKHKLIFRPLEKLQIQEIDNLVAKDYPLDDHWDQQFKPGLYLQVKSFLGAKKDLPTIEEQVKNTKYFNLINQHE